jgi:hypothetical protein
MTRTIPFLLLFFISLSSFSQSEGNWDVYMARYEKGPGSTVLDMALKNEAPNKSYPFLLKTGVKYKQCTSDGMPTEDEFPNLYAISDSAHFIIDDLVESKMAGSFTYQCERMDYYYVSDTTGLRKKLVAMYKKRFPSYTYTVSMKLDRKWEAYTTFLYPNEETMQFMQNLKVVTKLQDAGDKLDQPRLVDYLLYFPTDKDRKAFIEFAEKNNFKVEATDSMKEARLQYQLHLTRVDKVDVNSITAVTYQLVKDVARYNGEFDGWESIVVK